MFCYVLWPDGMHPAELSWAGSVREHPRQTELLRQFRQRVECHTCGVIEVASGVIVDDVVVMLGTMSSLVHQVSWTTKHSMGDAVGDGQWKLMMPTSRTEQNTLFNAKWSYRFIHQIYHKKRYNYCFWLIDINTVVNRLQDKLRLKHMNITATEWRTDLWPLTSSTRRVTTHDHKYR